MKVFTFHNFILGIFISLGLFLGFNLFGFCSEYPIQCSGNYISRAVEFHGVSNSINITDPNVVASAYNDMCYTQVANLSCTVSCAKANPSLAEPLSATLHIVTSYGDFSVCGGQVAVFTSTAAQTLYRFQGITTLMGVPKYCYLSIDYVKTGSTASDSSYYFTFNVSFDCKLVDTQLNYRTDRILSNTNEILASLGGGSGFDYTTPTFTTSVLDNTVEDDYYYTFSLSNNITFTTIPDFASISLIGVFQDGTNAVLKTFYFDNATLTDYPTQTLTIDNMSFSNKCMSTYLVTSCGGVDSPCFTFVPNNHLLLKHLNKVFNSWSDISSSEQLNNLNNTSGSVGNIISNNSTFENSAFTNLSDNLDTFGFDDWSLVPVSSELTTVKNIITMFYNVLPFKIQWLFTTVMALGLIMMLLTVGTRVVQRTGDFTRAKPVKMKDSSHRKGK